jgi:hypothetical protein
VGCICGLLDWIRLSTCTCSDTYQPEDDHINSIYIIYPHPCVFHSILSRATIYVYIYTLYIYIIATIELGLYYTKYSPDISMDYISFFTGY